MKIITFNTSNDIIIEPLEDRWYELKHDVIVNIFLREEGKLVYTAKAGFRFDGRSGGPLADFVVPNLGTQKEVACWLCHDIGAYDLYLSFSEINDLLAQMLVQSGVSLFKSWLVKKAVSLSDSWFGQPAPTDREYRNMNFISVRHMDK